MGTSGRPCKSGRKARAHLALGFLRHPKKSNLNHDVVGSELMFWRRAVARAWPSSCGPRRTLAPAPGQQPAASHASLASHRPRAGRENNGRSHFARQMHHAEARDVRLTRLASDSDVKGRGKCSAKAGGGCEFDRPRFTGRFPPGRPPPIRHSNQAYNLN